jgi:hypothetical protein
MVIKLLRSLREEAPAISNSRRELFIRLYTAWRKLT